MVINAATFPIEVILSLVVYGKAGKMISRVTGLDTDKLVATRLISLSAETAIFQDVEITSFEFQADGALVTSEKLREILPRELHDKIVG